MPEIKLKLDEKIIDVVVLEKHNNTYKIQYTDPNDNSIHRMWCCPNCCSPKECFVLIEPDSDA